MRINLWASIENLRLRDNDHHTRRSQSRRLEDGDSQIHYSMEIGNVGIVPEKLR